MKLINIFPIGNLGLHYTQSMHMFLTHLVEKYPFYAKFAKEVAGYKILDNSLIELGGAVDLQRVLSAAEQIGADEIILPDVFQDGPATIKAVNDALSDLIDRYPNRSWPYKLMAVAQGKNEEEWVSCYKQLLNNPDIDIIGIPKVLAKAHPEGRPHFVNTYCALDQKPHHLLGLWYSMQELEEYKKTSKKYKNVDVYPQGFVLTMMKIQSKSRFYFYKLTRMIRGIFRRIRLMFGAQR